MDVEVSVLGENRELASSDQEEPNFEESGPGDDTKEENDADEDEEEGDSENDEKRENEVFGDMLLEDDEENEEDYCPGGYHRISSGDLFNDG